MLRKLAVLPFIFISPFAFAEVSKDGVLNEVTDRFLQESANWAETITGYASWLFWTLVLISMVWTFGMMALRKADIGEFFAEFTRFTITTGFFWWLLTNGPKFSIDIINSLRSIAAEASGLPRGLNPSTPIDIAFDIIVMAAKSYSITSPIDNLSIFLTTLAILACMAVVAANVLLALVTAWIIAYAGVFVLGFGGSRWTSDIALNYYRSVVGIALKIMTITLIVGIAVSIMDGYHAGLSKGAPLGELMVIFVVSLVMVILIHSVPNVVANLIPGGGGAASSGSSFSAGALIGAAASAGAAAATVATTGGAAMAAGASNMAGGAQALMAAFNKANENVANGNDIMSAFSGSSGDGSGGGMPSEESTGDTPFAQAAGFGSESSGGQASRFMTAAARAGRVMADTGANLAKGTGAVAKAKAGEVMDGAKQRISETAGGKIASAIKGQGQQNDSGPSESSESETSDSSPSFDSNNLSGDADMIADFVNNAHTSFSHRNYQ